MMRVMLGTYKFSAEFGWFWEVGSGEEAPIELVFRNFGASVFFIGQKGERIT